MEATEVSQVSPDTALVEIPDGPEKKTSLQEEHRGVQEKQAPPELPTPNSLRGVAPSGPEAEPRTPNSINKAKPLKEPEKEDRKEPEKEGRKKPEKEEKEEAEPEKPNMEETIASLREEVERLRSELEAKETEEKLQQLEMKTQNMEKEIFDKLEAANTEKERLKTDTEKFADQTSHQLETLTKHIDNIMRTIRPKPAEETFSPTSVPPVVLQDAYEEVASDIFRKMLVLHGAAAIDKVKNTIESIRLSSSGMEFFEIVGDKRISVSGLANAIKKGLISPQQIQVTFDQFLKRLMAEVPEYKPLSLLDLIESGSRAYSVSISAEMVERAARMEKDILGLDSRLEAVEAYLKLET